MQRIPSKALFALVAIASLGVATPAAAQDQVPFRAYFAGTVVSTPLDFPIVRVDLSGAGQASYLGRFTKAAHHFVDVLDNPLAFFAGHSEATAINRKDKLFCDYSGTLVPTPTSAVDGIFLIEFEWELAGGTGRFTNATGGGTGFGWVDLNTGEFEQWLDGTMSNPSLNK